MRQGKKRSVMLQSHMIQNLLASWEENVGKLLI